MWHARADDTASTGKVAMAAAAATGAIEAGAGAVDAARSALAPGVELDDEDSLLGGEACECYQAATTVPPPREGGPVAAQQLPADGHDHGSACVSHQNPDSRIVRLARTRAKSGERVRSLVSEFCKFLSSNRMLDRKSKIINQPPSDFKVGLSQVPLKLSFMNLNEQNKSEFEGSKI